MSRTRKSLVSIPLIMGLALSATACGSAKDSPPAQGKASDGGNPMDTVLFGLGSSDAGKRLYGQECAFCHVGKATGTMMLGRRLGKDNAELVRRNDLEADFVKAVVRNGLINMPPFSKVELTDPELDSIAAYLARKDGK